MYIVHYKIRLYNVLLVQAEGSVMFLIGPCRQHYRAKFAIVKT